MTMEPSTQEQPTTAIPLQQSLFDNGYWIEVCFELDDALSAKNPAVMLGYLAYMYGSQSLFEQMRNNTLVVDMCAAEQGFDS